MMTWQSVRLCHVETVDYSSQDGPNCTNAFHSAHEVVLFFLLSGDHEGIEKPKLLCLQHNTTLPRRAFMS